ncbi:MAG: GNAT family N-acetyltransferase [Acidobacteriia bacterium]|nr:GNAT family N-acetyltransferase [Terriglobia bacterium]
MQVRILTESDAEAFRILRRERLHQEPHAFAESIAEHDALSLETIRTRLRRSGENFVVGAFEDEELVGIAGFSRSPRVKSRHKGIIWGVYVRSRARGQGAGRALISALIDRARVEPGLEQIQLSVSIGQEAARRLYESLGFEVFGRERHALKVDGHYVDEDHMVLWL